MTQKQTKARRALLDSAMRLLADNPGASFIEIADAAGIGRATLYRHFSNREALIRALTLEAIEATDRASEDILQNATSAFDAICLSFEAMVDVGDRYYFLARLPEPDDEDIKALLEKQNQDLHALIVEAQREGSLDVGVPSFWVTAVVSSLIYVAWDMRGKASKLSKDDLVALCVRTLRSGLGPT